MQASEFLASYQLFVIALVMVLIVLTIIRLLAVKQYRLKRAGDAEESILASLGEKVSNTRWSFFDVVYLIIYILAISQGLATLGLLVGYEILQIPLMVFAAGLVVVSVWFLQFTVRGKAYRRTERILDDHQTLGHEDWIIRKHLAELVHESEGENIARAEVAKATLENLKNKENTTGDAVRQILLNPDQLRDIDRMKSPPSLWKSLRFSILILIVFAVILLYFVYNYFSGMLSQIDLIMNVLPVTMLSILVLSLCLCVESTNARSRRKKVLFGV